MCLGCSKEPSHWDVSFEYPQHMFWLRNKKIKFYLHTFIYMSSHQKSCCTDCRSRGLNLRLSDCLQDWTYLFVTGSQGKGSFSGIRSTRRCKNTKSQESDKSFESNTSFDTTGRVKTLSRINASPSKKKAKDIVSARTRRAGTGSHRDANSDTDTVKTETGDQVNFVDLLTLNAPIATKVVCFSRLLKCLRSLYGKQCGFRSDCSYRSSLFWVHAVCFYT